MKKLMFAAALAATGMTFAATTPAGQVYDVSLSIKSTKAAKATINNKTNPFLGEDKEEVIYRTQTTYTWKGLIWGCSCETIDGVWEEAYTGELIDYSSIKGCILWDTKAKEAVYIGYDADITDPETAYKTGFGWDFINAIDKTGKKVEGSWKMTQIGPHCDDTGATIDDYVFEFRGAGFGTLNIKDLDDCGANYINSISGNFAGWMIAPDAMSVKNPTGCTFCGYTKPESTCVPSDAWDFCDCTDESLLDMTRTAAYGTWSVKYNSSLSKKLSQPLSISDKGLKGVVVSIRDAYNFKSLPLVAAKIEAIENVIWEIPTKCDELGEALDDATTVAQAAQQKYDDAKDALDAVSYENLKAAVTNAQAEVVVAEKAYTTATNELKKAVDKYNKAYCNYTNVNATIAYTNALVSAFEMTTNTIGCVQLTNVVTTLSNNCTFARITVTGKDTSTIKDWAGCIKLADDYEQAVKDADEAKKDAAEDAKKALETVEEKKDDVDAAKQNLKNGDLLRALAEDKLDKAETVLNAANEKLQQAQAAYDEAGCEDDED